MLPRNPPLTEQFAYHVSEDRGAWESPLVAFKRSRRRSLDATRKSKTPRELLPVPSAVQSAEEARRLVDRAFAESCASQLSMTGPSHTATAQIAFTVAMATSAFTALLQLKTSGLDYWVTVVLASATIAMLLVGMAWAATATMRDTDVAGAVWAERHRRYNERLTALLADEATQQDDLTTPAWRPRWLRRR